MNPAAGARDDQLNGPHVTPEPAPQDDQIVALVSAAIGACVLAALLVARWLRRNVEVTWK